MHAKPDLHNEFETMITFSGSVISDVIQPDIHQLMNKKLRSRVYHDNMQLLHLILTLLGLAAAGYGGKILVFDWHLKVGLVWIASGLIAAGIFGQGFAWHGGQSTEASKRERYRKR